MPASSGAYSKTVDPAYTRVLRSIPLFSSLDPAEFSEVVTQIETRRFRKNQIVLLEEETTSFIYVVFSGKVRVVHEGEAGGERILAVHKRGDIFGEMALLDSRTAPATVIAMEEAEIGLISRETFQKLFLKNEKSLLQLIAILCRRLREAQLIMKVSAIPDAELRLRSILDYLSLLHGVKDDRGLVIALRLTHKDLAGYISVRRETVTRLLQQMAAKGDLQILDNHTILLKRNFIEAQKLL